jgi:hypothetical protein
MIALGLPSEDRNMSEEQDFDPQPDPPSAADDEYADSDPQPDPGVTAEPPDELEPELNPQPEPPG